MIKSKIFVAVMLSVIALVLLVTASVAWFTISTNPEISGMQVNLVAPDRLLVSEDGSEGSWEESLNLSSSFEHYAPLKPVSTVDGLHWFLPEYNITGSLKDVNQFELDDSLKYANSLIYQKVDGEWVKLAGNALQNASNNGYYVYADFFLKTEEDATDVHLTFANPYAAENTELNDTDGTYVLPTVELVENEDYVEPTEPPEDSEEDDDDGGGEEEQEQEGKYILKDISNRTQNVVRVGFLVNPVYDEDSDTKVADIAIDESSFAEEDDYSTDNYAKNQFFIYEPNADLRTSENKPITNAGDPSVADRYIQSYDYKATKTTEGEGEEEKEKITPEDYNKGYYYETLPVKKTSEPDAYNPQGEVIKYKYEQTRISPEQLISQRYCEWNPASLKETMENNLYEKKWWSSKDVQYPYGGFLNSNSLYNGTVLYDRVFPGLQLSAIGGTGAGINVGKQVAAGSDESAIEVYPYDNVVNYSSDQTIVKLEKNKPVRIRLFIWLEGQDIDCWNDVAAGGFVVNLELGGITHSDKPAAPMVQAVSVEDGHEIVQDEWTMYDVKFNVSAGTGAEIDHYIFTTNGKDWNEYIDGTHTKIFAPGRYNISFKAVTASGEQSEATALPAFNLVKAPKADVSFSNEKDETTGKYPVGTTVKAEIPDGTFSKNTMTILYSTDGGENWSPYVEPLTMSEAGEYNYIFRTVESNTGSEGIISVKCYAEIIEEPEE